MRLWWALIVKQQHRASHSRLSSSTAYTSTSTSTATATAAATAPANKAASSLVDPETLSSHFVFRDIKDIFPRSFFLIPDVITEDEEMELILTLDKVLSRRKYESNHWDSVIAQYKEVEITKQLMTPLIMKVSERCKNIVCKSLDRQIMDQFLPIHLIDLAEAGFISPHVDSVKFSGDFIAGLSLMSHRIMRLSPAKYYDDFSVSSLTQTARAAGSSVGGGGGGGRGGGNSGGSCSNSCSSYGIKEESFEFMMPRRSMYVIQGPLRYDFTHEVLGKEQTSWYGLGSSIPPVSISRRLSLMFRNMHSDDLTLMHKKGK